MSPATVFMAAALDYAARGWPVLPLHPRGKTPRILNGFKRASMDPDAVSAWWTDEPRANIGIATGIACDVIDLDGDTGINQYQDILPPDFLATSFLVRVGAYSADQERGTGATGFGWGEDPSARG